ncbi:MAG: hypothetical protein M1814_002529 [Vezdaea aestivalis]|nr:MAG: hypothetical protein M1814_002529 [Vezdaea aestivalis]
MAVADIGESIPPNTPHAVSVSLPTWSAIVGYETGEEWVLSKMMTGYPRFFIHKKIRELAQSVRSLYGREGEEVALFPSIATALLCEQFIKSQQCSSSPLQSTIIDFRSRTQHLKDSEKSSVITQFAALLYPETHKGLLKVFWQHTGDGISSRRAEHCQIAVEAGEMNAHSRDGKPLPVKLMRKGPRRYQRNENGSDQDRNQQETYKNVSTGKDVIKFVEERYGRNLEASLVENAKTVIKRRIAGSLTANVDLEGALEIPNGKRNIRRVPGFSTEDVYLFPTGMSAIFNSHRLLLSTRGASKSICFGFPYIDTLKILQKWGPGCLFYGLGEESELDDLEHRLQQGERFLALYCEFPGNPLLKSPNLPRIRTLADQYSFAVVVDETIGNFLNVHVLPFSDIVVSSLTKIFSGDSNVMGGSLILNPQTPFYHVLKKVITAEYEDNYWAEDAIFMERNSRDFVQRIEKINQSAETVCDMLNQHPLIKKVYYPKYSESKNNYDKCRNGRGGYGGLLSLTFFSTADAVTFFDQLETAKGPSLGTNFTLSSPFTLLAHYSELDWAAQYGVEADLVRISVGLEDTDFLLGSFDRALKAVAKMRQAGGL